MTTSERVAYLRGLIEGMEIDETTKEGKILLAMVDILDDLALSVEDIDESIAELDEGFDALDEDLGELEEDFYEFDEDECDCDDYDELDEFDGDLYEVTCPTCGEVLCVDTEMLEEGETVCPKCGEALEFDFEDEDDED